MKKLFICIVLVLFVFKAGRVRSQSQADTYIWPTDPLVKENLEKWRGYKFGVLIHMGLYSQLGVVESWGLCPEDWVGRPGFDSYCDYASTYRNTKSIFNPVKFDPGKWAKAIKASGAKYLIYSTKHHDGFCLFDSKYTQFKVTDKDCPFSSNPRANVVKEVFDAGRKEGLHIGAYFSKPDWSCPDFWWPYYPPFDRNPNYDITKHPERWKRYIEYTQNQLREITSEYGKIDILWLDGCWVMPKSSINKHVEEFCKYPHDLDIDMKSISGFARKSQPGMLIVDRWVQGPYEDYLTPEQKTPEKALTVPWESCITLGDAWGWVKNDNYKSNFEVIQLLVKIVAKGGNLLLGIGPAGNGEFEPAVYDRLNGIGKWLSINGEAIYETTPVAPYQEGNIAYTSKNDHTTYAIYLPTEFEKEHPPVLKIHTALMGKLSASIPALNLSLKAKKQGDRLMVSIPKEVWSKLRGEPAVVLKISNR